MKKRKNITVSFIITLTLIFVVQMYGLWEAYKSYKLQFDSEVYSVMEQSVFNVMTEMDAPYASGGILSQSLFEDGAAQYGEMMTAFFEHGETMTAAYKDSLIKELYKNPVVQHKMEDLFQRMMSGTYKSDIKIVPRLMAIIKGKFATMNIDMGFDYIVVNPFANSFTNRILLVSSERFNKLPIESKDLDFRQYGFSFRLGFSHAAFYKYAFDRMKIILVCNFFLLIILLGTLFYLSRSFFNQEKLTLLKNDFVSNMSHEIKTPVATATVALGALSRYDYSNDKDKAEELIMVANRELKRLSIIVDKILRTTLIDADYLSLYKEEVNLVAFINEIVSSFYTIFQEQHIAFSFLYETDDISACIDKSHFINVIYNLLDNAVKYKTEDSSISIQLYYANGNIQIKVMDNGLGVPAQYKSRIFEKFFRVPSGDIHSIKGQGIGLYYVQQVIAKHGGTISLEDNKQLTIFHIKIPAV